MTLQRDELTILLRADEQRHDVTRTVLWAVTLSECFEHVHILGRDPSAFRFRGGRGGRAGGRETEGSGE